LILLDAYDERGKAGKGALAGYGDDGGGEQGQADEQGDDPFRHCVFLMVCVLYFWKAQVDSLYT